MQSSYDPLRERDINMPTDQYMREFVDDLRQADPEYRSPPPALRPGDESRGETEFTPIITAGGEIVIDPEIVCALGDGDPEMGKKMLGDSVTSIRKQTVQHLKQLPKPVE
jgi:hypothetical protein